MKASKQFIIEVKLKRAQVPSFEEYPFCLDAVRNLSTLKLHNKVTYIIGENGSGKSTIHYRNTLPYSYGISSLNHISIRRRWRNICSI